MELAGRRYLCAGCRAVVVICSHCDRGNRYCNRACSQAVRKRCMREAGQRYQSSLPGRHRHAERQRRYRARMQKVTHQGSPPPAPPVQLPSAPTPPQTSAGWRCWRCQRALPECIRQDFLRRRIRRPQRTDRRNPPDGPDPRN